MMRNWTSIIFYVLMVNLTLGGYSQVPNNETTIDTVQVQIEIEDSSSHYDYIPERKHILSIGYVYDEAYRGAITVGLEHQIKKYASLNFDLGFLPFYPFEFHSARYFTIRTSFEAKYFFALRKRPLEGIFVGAHIGGTINNQYFPNSNQTMTRTKWGQIGVTVGIQKRIFDKVSFGIGFEGGYGGEILYKYFDQNGHPNGKLVGKLPFSGYSVWQIGYKF